MHTINCIFALWQLPFQRSKINQRRWETECWILEYQIELPKSKLTQLWWEQICSIVMEMKIVSQRDKMSSKISQNDLRWIEISRENKMSGRDKATNQLKDYQKKRGPGVRNYLSSTAFSPNIELSRYLRLEMTSYPFSIWKIMFQTFPVFFKVW